MLEVIIPDKSPNLAKDIVLHMFGVNPKQDKCEEIHTKIHHKYLKMKGNKIISKAAREKRLLWK